MDVVTVSRSRQTPAWMRRWHLAVGLLATVTFLGTGQYMDRFLDHLHGMDAGPRLLYRTRHIFILLVALLHLALGVYAQPHVHPSRRACQYLGSLLTTVAAALFFAAFIYEPARGDLRSPLTHYASYAVVAGVALHLLGGIGATTRSPGE
jgi:hypothetical protein